MPDVTVGNQAVAVGLFDTESFTPASGTTIVATVQASDGASVEITANGKIISDVATTFTQNVASEISVVLSDDTKVKASGGEALITGFIV